MTRPLCLPGILLVSLLEKYPANYLPAPAGCQSANGGMLNVQYPFYGPWATAEREDEMRRCTLMLLIALLGTFVAGPVLADHHDPPRILPAEVMKKQMNGEEIVFFDTRTDAARAAGQPGLPGAIQINNNEILHKVMQKTPKDSFIVTYCT